MHDRVILGHLLRRAGDSDKEHREENIGMTHNTLGNADDAVGEIIELIRKLPKHCHLEPWVVSKITIAEDYFDTVRDYLKQIIDSDESSESDDMSEDSEELSGDSDEEEN